MDAILAGNSLNAPIECRIEISGWGDDNSFFVERTELLWASDGEKHVQLPRCLPEGAMVFISLLASEPTPGSVPVVYKVHGVTPLDSVGHCQMRLVRMQPRCRESLGGQRASNVAEGSQNARDSKESRSALRHEEILQ